MGKNGFSILEVFSLLDRNGWWIFHLPVLLAGRQKLISSPETHLYTTLKEMIWSLCGQCFLFFVVLLF